MGTISPSADAVTINLNTRHVFCCPNLYALAMAYETVHICGLNHLEKNLLEDPAKCKTSRSEPVNVTATYLVWIEIRIIYDDSVSTL